MTKLEELQAAWDAAEVAYVIAARKHSSEDHDDAYAAADTADAARDAYQAELKKTQENTQ